MLEKLEAEKGAAEKAGTLFKIFTLFLLQEVVSASMHA